MECDMNLEWEWESVRETAKELLDYADRLKEYAGELLDISAAGLAALTYLSDRKEN